MPPWWMLWSLEEYQALDRNLNQLMHRPWVPASAGQQRRPKKVKK